MVWNSAVLRCEGACLRAGGGRSWQPETLRRGTEQPETRWSSSPGTGDHPLTLTLEWSSLYRTTLHRKLSYNQRLNWRNAGSRLSGIKKHLFFQLGMLSIPQQLGALLSAPSGSAISLKQPGSAVSLRVFQNAFHSLSPHAAAAAAAKSLQSCPTLHANFPQFPRTSPRLGLGASVKHCLDILAVNLQETRGRPARKKNTQLEAGTRLLWCLLSAALPCRQVLTQFQGPAIWSTQLQLWNTQIKFLEGRNYVRRVHQAQCLAQNRPLINTCEQRTP